ncbi:DUF5684 domain-containing protein [Sharpea azabuensis]|uniref:DUF5684 domain-containing protein n=1 Tax=Sharpea azabuensis TaxID=322505 RepID=UPI00156398D3|nr:DUF5684 domain-containing protein [Sharpea azabuensis]
MNTLYDRYPNLEQHPTAGLIVLILTVIAMWKIFNKAGRSGILSLIPVVNTWVLFEIAGFPGIVSLFGWIGLLCLGLVAIPALGALLMFVGLALILIFLVACLIFNFRLSSVFGHGFLFGLGLCFFNTIFLLILGFGSSKYQS